MTIMSPDGELVSDYASKRSETAFRALVARHVDLVFATALRQVGDRGLAEEITQNVFIALARKCPRLGGIDCAAAFGRFTGAIGSASGRRVIAHGGIGPFGAGLALHGRARCGRCERGVRRQPGGGAQSSQ
jgi:hypothetical protein